VKVLNEFMERWKKNAWSKEEDRDVEFWEQQKQEFLHDNATYVLAVAAL